MTTTATIANTVSPPPTAPPTIAAVLSTLKIKNIYYNYNLDNNFNN